MCRLMELIVNRSTFMMIKQAKFLWTVLHHFLIDVGVVFTNNSIPLLSGYVELKLGTWIPLGLHLDQSNKKGGLVKPSARNSINILSSYVANNPICVVSSYVQALLTLRVLEYGVQDPFGFLLDCIWIRPTIWAGRWSPVHITRLTYYRGNLQITRYIYYRVMCNPF